MTDADGPSLIPAPITPAFRSPSVHLLHGCRRRRVLRRKRVMPDSSPNAAVNFCFPHFPRSPAAERIIPGEPTLSCSDPAVLLIIPAAPVRHRPHAECAGAATAQSRDTQTRGLLSGAKAHNIITFKIETIKL